MGQQLSIFSHLLLAVTLTVPRLRAVAGLSGALLAVAARRRVRRVARWGSLALSIALLVVSPSCVALVLLAVSPTASTVTLLLVVAITVPLLPAVAVTSLGATRKRVECGVRVRRRAIMTSVRD